MSAIELVRKIKGWQNSKSAKSGREYLSMYRLSQYRKISSSSCTGNGRL